MKLHIMRVAGKRRAWWVCDDRGRLIKTVFSRRRAVELWTDRYGEEPGERVNYSGVMRQSEAAMLVASLEPDEKPKKS